MRSSFFSLMIREWAILNEHNIQILHYGLEKWCWDVRAMEFGDITQSFKIVRVTAQKGNAGKYTYKNMCIYIYTVHMVESKGLSLTESSHY